MQRCCLRNCHMGSHMFVDCSWNDKAILGECAAQRVTRDELRKLPPLTPMIRIDEGTSTWYLLPNKLERGEA